MVSSEVTTPSLRVFAAVRSYSAGRLDADAASVYIRVPMKAESGGRKTFFRFLYRLKAGGRTNMYGAVPYLMSAFGLNREQAFTVVCEWLDQQARVEPPSPSPRPRKPPRRRAA